MEETYILNSFFLYSAKITHMKNLKTSVLFKAGVILTIVLLLLIPTSMVKDLIREREQVQRNAVHEVSAKWGGEQTITGPFISIPYDKYVKKYDKSDSTEKIIKLKEWIHFLPQKLVVAGAVNPEKRYRGIYEVVVYESNITIQGGFDNINTSQFDINPAHIHFENSVLNIGITDLKGIDKQISLDWNNSNIAFNSGVSDRDIVQSGINAPISLIADDSLSYQFQLMIDLKGSQRIYFTPLGKTTDVTLTSNWTTPSFKGNYLPDNREVTVAGFSAHWNVLHLNRNYPQSWVSSNYKTQSSNFGVDLLIPVDNYKKSHRVARYAILFLALTFMVFFFVEALNNVFIHPMQYLLVGIAIIVFYSLLLALSEHVTFNIAYLISMIATLILISSYTLAILKSKKIGGLMFSILLILYLFIFTIIQMEDYALLIGSIGIFVILALVMFFSRKIDWYQLKIGQND